LWWATRAYGERPGPDRNAVVYDEHGLLVAEETWGDDISHLTVAGDGTV
jgi:hypothetical protein